MSHSEVLPPNPPPSIHVHLRQHELGHDAQDFKASNPLKDSMELKTSRLPTLLRHGAQGLIGAQESRHGAQGLNGAQAFKAATVEAFTSLKECDDSGESVWLS